MATCAPKKEYNSSPTDNTGRVLKWKLEKTLKMQLNMKDDQKHNIRCTLGLGSVAGNIWQERVLHVRVKVCINSYKFKLMLLIRYQSNKLQLYSHLANTSNVYQPKQIFKLVFFFSNKKCLSYHNMPGKYKPIFLYTLT